MASYDYPSGPRNKADIEELVTFARQLHDDHRLVQPESWHVDWNQSPPATKQYGPEHRVSMDDADQATKRVLHLLIAAFGVSSLRFADFTVPSSPESPLPPIRRPEVLLRRPFPSGGAMYPAEAYLVDLDQESAFYFDAYRHDLVRISESVTRASFTDVFDQDSTIILGNRRFFVVLTVRYIKNFYKYHDVSYRLASIDAGLAEGRAIRVFSTSSSDALITRSFDDALVAELLHLHDEHEAPVSIISTGVNGEIDAPIALKTIGIAEHFEAIRSIHVSDRIRDFDRASANGRGHRVAVPADSLVDIAGVRNIDVSRDTHIATARRVSGGRSFISAPVSSESMRHVLSSALIAVTNSVSLSLPGLRVLCAVNRVSDVPNGFYEFVQEGELVEIRRALNPGLDLLGTMLQSNVNIELAAFSVHVAGPMDWTEYGRGARGYREQQLDVGRAVEAVTHGAQEVELSSHTLLGFLAPDIDALYELKGTGLGVFIQTSVGHSSIDAGLEVSA